MTREEKNQAIAALKEQFESASSFYITDASTLDVEAVNGLRRMCFERGVKFNVAKNTLIKKALEQIDGDYNEVYDSLKGPTSIMFSEVANAPAKLIKEFREKHDKPVLKIAYIDSATYIGDDQIETLSKLKSKEELIGEIIGLLQSPAKNVIGALQSSGDKLAGIVKTLSERPE